MSDIVSNNGTATPEPGVLSGNVTEETAKPESVEAVKPADDFKAPESQEQLDKIIQARLARQEAKIREEFEGFDSYKTEAEQYRQLLESQKTDEQKREEQLAADKAASETLASENESLKAKIADLELAGLRAEIAAAKGVPAGLASRLQGKTQEEIEADCEALLSAVKPAPSSTADRPKGDPLSGSGDKPFDPNSLVDKLLR